MTDLHLLRAKVAKLKIGIIGDVMLDRYIVGSATRLSPEAPVPIVKVQKHETRAGGAANVALNIVSMGAKAELLSVVGDDDDGRLLSQMIKQQGATVGGVLHDLNRMTTVKTRVIAQNQQVVRLDQEQTHALAVPARDKLLKLIAKTRVDAWLISDYGKGVIDRSLVQACVQKCKIVVVDPIPHQAHLYQGVSHMTPNEKESHLLAQELGTKQMGDHWERQILTKLKLTGGLLVTRGAKGMQWYGPRQTIEIPTVARQVFDVTGAGDTVIAWFTTLLAAGVSVEEAMTLSNRAAADVVGKLGTATASWAAVESEETALHVPSAQGK